MVFISKISDADWRYPAATARRSGWLDVAAPHRVYFEEYGRADGEPVLFLHGGPGGGTSPDLARFFDPARYRVILFDQRGCGQSTPSATAPDARPALAQNTTADLIHDIRALRRHLGVSGPCHVFGGSWGSTLALAYAIAHPDEVLTLILRGIFLCRRKDLDYFYQGNAARFAADPNDTTLPGAYLFYPEAWRPYVEAIAPEDRGDMIKAYATIFSDPAADPDRVTQAAIAWSVWEGTTSYLALDAKGSGSHDEPAFARAFARIENHYFMNGAFLGGTGEANRDQDYILGHAARIAHIPTYIVHGRYDQVCPLFQAEELAAALVAAGARNVELRRTAAGHSALERENNRALSDIMDALPAPRVS